MVLVEVPTGVSTTNICVRTFTAGTSHADSSTWADCRNKYNSDMSLVMRKQAFCICENKDADQLRGNREADQRLCFRYPDRTIPLFPKSEISSL